MRKRRDMQPASARRFPGSSFIEKLRRMKTAHPNYSFIIERRQFRRVIWHNRGDSQLIAHRGFQRNFYLRLKVLALITFENEYEKFQAKLRECRPNT